MCLSPDAYVTIRVYNRLVDAGVSREKALAVGKKVGRRYAARRAADRVRYFQIEGEPFWRKRD